MEFKNIKELSNGELDIYKLELYHQYEALKTKIDRMCDELDKISSEYDKAKKEIRIRQSKIYK